MCVGPLVSGTTPPAAQASEPERTLTAFSSPLPCGSGLGTLVQLADYYPGAPDDPGVGGHSALTPETSSDGSPVPWGTGTWVRAVPVQCKAKADSLGPMPTAQASPGESAAMLVSVAWSAVIESAAADGSPAPARVKVRPTASDRF